MFLLSFKIAETSVMKVGVKAHAEQNGTKNLLPLPLGISWNLLESLGISWNLLESLGISWNLLESLGHCDMAK